MPVDGAGHRLVARCARPRRPCWLMRSASSAILATSFTAAAISETVWLVRWAAGGQRLRVPGHRRR